MIHALHGAVGMAADWEPWADLGVRGLDLWRFLEEGDISLEEAGRRVAAQAADGDTLLGYSMGGRIALHALAHRAWERVIIISAHPGLEDGHAQRLAQDARWAARAADESLLWCDFLAEWDAQGVLQGELHHPWADRRLLAKHRQAVARSFRCWSLGRQVRKISYQGSVTWVVGEQDRKFRALAEELSGVEVLVVPHSGHRVPWQSEVIRELF